MFVFVDDQGKEAENELNKITDCIGSCKSNYQTITTTMVPSISSKKNVTFYENNIKW
jgi:hypothetical protein